MSLFNNTSEEVIKTIALSKTYYNGDLAVEAVKGVDLNIHQGEYVAITGSSGSGKSTFLNVIGCLDKATSGEYYLDGISINERNRKELADIRNQKIGFVFQGYNLLARTSALENVEMPLVYNRWQKLKKKESRERAMYALEQVGLADRVHHHPNELSGGQQQRVAIARALVNQPAILLADEPTGNLDSRTTEDIMMLFEELNQQGLTVVMITHEPDVAARAQREVEFKDGLIIKDLVQKIA